MLKVQTYLLFVKVVWKGKSNLMFYIYNNNVKSLEHKDVQRI